MNLLDVRSANIGRKKKIRLGRGISAGRGKRSGKGQRGQLSRSGISFSPYFEGGQMPLARKFAKRGFNNKRFALKSFIVNIGLLNKICKNGEKVSPETLVEKSVIRRSFDKLKILADGKLEKKLDVYAHEFSAKARESIDKAGGSATILPLSTTKKRMVWLSSIEKAYKEGESVTVETLVGKNLIKSADEKYVIVQKGILSKKLKFRLDTGSISDAARKSIIKTGSVIFTRKKTESK